MEFPSLNVVLVTVILAGCTVVETVPRHTESPAARSPSQLKAEEDFVANAAARFGGDRQMASAAWSREADRFLGAYKLEAAMRWYNKAWLLDRQSYKPYWGIGRVRMAEEKFDDAVRHLEAALPLCRDDRDLASLLSDLGTAYASKSAPDLVRMNDSFNRASSLDASNAMVWKQWAAGYFLRGDYPQAWETVRQARLSGVTFFEPDLFDFRKKLEARMPEPASVSATPVK